MRVLDIVNLLGYDYVGDTKINIDSIKFASMATENDIAIIKNKKDCVSTQAKVVLTNLIIITDKNVIYSYEDVETAAVRIANMLIANGDVPNYKAVPDYTYNNNSLFGKRSIIGKDTVVGPFCVIGDDVTIGSNCVIEDNVHIGSGTIVGDNVTILSGTKIGVNSNYYYIDGSKKLFCGIGITKISSGVCIGCNSVVQRGTFSDTCIGENVKIGNLVEIAHDVVIGNDCQITSQVALAGNVAIGNDVVIYGQAGVANGISIGDDVTVMGRSAVTKDVKSGMKVSGMFAQEHAKELKVHAKLRRL